MHCYAVGYNRCIGSDRCTVDAVDVAVEEREDTVDPIHCRYCSFDWIDDWEKEKKTLELERRATRVAFEVEWEWRGIEVPS